MAELNKKFLGIGFIFLLLVALLFAGNMWISQQIQSFKETPLTPENIKETTTAQTIQPTGNIPVIDPVNDPLAPMPKPAPMPSRPKTAHPEPIHELPSDSEILTQ